MIKIVLDYDKDADKIIDPDNGRTIAHWAGLAHHAAKESEGVKVSDLVELKEAGYTAEEIIELKKKGVI